MTWQITWQNQELRTFFLLILAQTFYNIHNLIQETTFLDLFINLLVQKIASDTRSGLSTAPLSRVIGLLHLLSVQPSALLLISSDSTCGPQTLTLDNSAAYRSNITITGSSPLNLSMISYLPLRDSTDTLLVLLSTGNAHFVISKKILSNIYALVPTHKESGLKSSLSWRNSLTNLSLITTYSSLLHS